MLAAIAFFLVSLSVQSADQRPFNAAVFQAALGSGKPVLVEIHADWCPTCKVQLPIIEKLSSEPRFANMTRFRVDFDAQKDVVKQFGARMQSTLVLFKSGKELARSVGETSEDNIRAMLNKAI